MAAKNKVIGAFEAKTKLSALLEEVRQGETIIISHRGHPIARLCPLEPSAEDAADRRRKAVEQLKEFRRRHRLKGLKVKDLIEEGRK